MEWLCSAGYSSDKVLDVIGRKFLRDRLLGTTTFDEKGALFLFRSSTGFPTTWKRLGQGLTFLWCSETTAGYLV